MGAKNSKLEQGSSATSTVKGPNGSASEGGLQPSQTQQRNELNKQPTLGNSKVSNSRDSVAPLSPGEPVVPFIPSPKSAENHIASSLAEFAQREEVLEVSAQDSFAHWDTQAAKADGAADNIGGNKVINRKLQQTMRNTMRNTMCNGDLRQLVKLPSNADYNEWIALNTIHFYRTCSLIGESYRELCTSQTCPLMSAGNVEYLWKDDHEYPRPTRVPACVYMEHSLREALAAIEDESLFPMEATQPFPHQFLQKVKEIFKRLFRQFAHLYYSHYDQIKVAGSSKHLNSSFKHFIYFVLEFDLVDSNSLAPLQKFIDHIMNQNPKHLSSA
jgi:MOB kinase activator 1